MINKSPHSKYSVICYVIIAFTLQIALLLQSFSVLPFTYKNSIFYTFQSPTLDFIFQNLSWILYYLIGEMLILPNLEELMLNPNPMWRVRYPDRSKVFQMTLGRLVVTTISYNLVYFIVMGLCGGFKNLNLLLFLFVNVTLSFVAVTLLLLLISLLFTQALSWQVGIVLGIVALAFKTNFLLFVTTPDLNAIYLELITSVILIIVICFVNKKVEVM